MRKLYFLLAASLAVSFLNILSKTFLVVVYGVAARQNHESRLLEIGAAPKRASRRVAAEFKVVSYNIRWRSGEDLSKLIELLKSEKEIGGATILALQEVDRNKKRSNNTNTAKLLWRRVRNALRVGSTA